MSDEVRAWVEVVVTAVRRVVGDRDDLAAVRVGAGPTQNPFVILVPRRAAGAVALHVGWRKAIEGYVESVVRLLPLLDAGGLRAWEALRDSGAEHEEVSEALQAGLASANLPRGVPGLVFGTDGAWSLAERYLPPEQLAVFDRLPEPSDTDAPRSREALAELMRQHGVDPSLAEDAAWGLALVPGDGESRLGGHPVLEGEWPRNDGYALTHLASIALAELPDFEDRDLLPADGTLVFLADFSDAHGDWDVAGTGGPEALVLYVPAGRGAVATAPHEPRGEREMPVVLQERRVRLSPVLTLPFPKDLDDAEMDALIEFSVAQPSADHLLLGHPVLIQDNPPEDGPLSLLQLNWDEALGFMFGDGGQITFFGHADDLRAGRWDRLTAQLDSS